MCLNNIYSNMVYNSKHWKQYKYLSEEDSWIQLQSIYVLGYYVTIKKNKEIFLCILSQWKKHGAHDSVVNMHYGFWVFTTFQELGTYSYCYQQLPLEEKKA